VSKEVLDDTLRCLALLLNPFAPHLSEECYEMIGEKEFSSMAAWPEYNDELIDEELHFVEDVIKDTKKDIMSVIALSKIEKPSTIKLIIADQWKYEMYSRVCLISKDNASRNISLISKELMASDLKKHGQEIMKMLPRIMDKLPSCVLWQDMEYDAFLDERGNLEKEFGCDVEIIKESESNETKARNASPGKPAIIVK
jgi:leucyl-tRNA synthetase